MLGLLEFHPSLRLCRSRSCAVPPLATHSNADLCREGMSETICLDLLFALWSGARSHLFQGSLDVCVDAVVSRFDRSITLCCPGGCCSPLQVWCAAPRSGARNDKKTLVSLIVHRKSNHCRYNLPRAGPAVIVAIAQMLERTQLRDDMRERGCGCVTGKTIPRDRGSNWLRIRIWNAEV